MEGTTKRIIRDRGLGIFHPKMGGESSSITPAFEISISRVSKKGRQLSLNCSVGKRSRASQARSCWA
jgi:hypothetical protein